MKRLEVGGYLAEGHVHPLYISIVASAAVTRAARHRQSSNRSQLGVRNLEPLRSMHVSLSVLASMALPI